jgi:hypothetical protein
MLCVLTYKTAINPFTSFTNRNLLRRNQNYAPVFPSGDGVACAFVCEEGVLDGAAHGLFD